MYEANLLDDIHGQSFAGLTAAVKCLKGVNLSTSTLVNTVANILDAINQVMNVISVVML